MTDLTERLRKQVEVGLFALPDAVKPVSFSEALDALENLTQEVERLRGLLIDPGDPAWEDARTVLATELRKADMADHADDVVAGRGLHVPSWIALNLIAHSRKSLTQENARLREALEEISGLVKDAFDGVIHAPLALDAIDDVARKALGGGDEQ